MENLTNLKISIREGDLAEITALTEELSLDTAVIFGSLSSFVLFHLRLARRRRLEALVQPRPQEWLAAREEDDPWTYSGFIIR